MYPAHPVQDAWRKGLSVSVHGWIYSLRDGLLVDLGFSAAEEEAVASAWVAAVRQVGEQYALGPVS